MLGFGFFGYINPKLLGPPTEDAPAEAVADILARALPQPSGFRTVQLCCGKCGSVSKLPINSKTQAGDVARWINAHKHCLD